MARQVHAPTLCVGYYRQPAAAISVPDETFAQAERRAAELGMSRSEFVTRAVQRYLEQLDAESITEQIDAAIGLHSDDDSAKTAVGVGHRLLTRSEDAW
jgi:metal-responsive CopG/Arc/MetJ family transcriptional regulator